MTEITERETKLRELVLKMKRAIALEQSMIALYEKEITVLHQKRCSHIDATVDDNGYKVYCYECGKNF